MKIHINPDGSMELDVAAGDGKTAAEFVAAVQDRHKQEVEANEAVVVTRERAAETANLSAVMYRTWEFLVENDRPEGVHTSAVARAFGIPDTTAIARLRDLLKEGNAKRVRRGYYRACTNN